MQLTSPAFENNAMIPIEYTCEGEDINPPLEIADVPKGAKSLVLIVDDPDAPGDGWVHWTVFNIGPAVREIPEDSVPEGAVQGMTDFGKPGYGGPCPPEGVHHYHFKLYALNTILGIAEPARKEDIEDAMEGHILKETMLLGLYEKTGE